jgi:FMN phosphatase YigB (HAD superfamily)
MPLAAMPLPPVVFDLDDTLLDSRALRADRAAGNWREVLSRLDEVSRFEVADGEPQVTELPRLAREESLQGARTVEAAPP